MSEAQIHLLLNHIPVMGSLFATAILIWGLVRKQQDVIQTALYLFIISAVFAIPVYFSGEGAEEAVEHLPAVSEALIEDHEHLAKTAMFIIEALGLASIGALFLSIKNKLIPVWYSIALLVLALINGGVMAQTAHLGGLIRHSEIRQGASSGGRESEAEEGRENEADEARENKAKEGSENEADEAREHESTQSKENSALPAERSEANEKRQHENTEATEHRQQVVNQDRDGQSVTREQRENNESHKVIAAAAKVMPLEALLKKAFPNRKVHMIEVKLETESGQQVYELEWLEQGIKNKAYFNALTGERVSHQE